MMECPFHECRLDTVIPMKSLTHLIVAVGDDNRTYIHGPYETDEGKAWIMRMIIDTVRFMGVDLQEVVNKERELYGSGTPLPRGAIIQ